MEEWPKFRMATGIVFLAVGAGLLGLVLLCVLDYLFLKPGLCGGDPMWKLWIFRFPTALCALLPGIAFLREGVARLKRSPNDFLWAFVGSLTLLSAILVYHIRIGDMASARTFALSRLLFNSVIGIALGATMLVFILFAVRTKGIRAAISRKKFLVAGIILCQLGIIFGWHRIASFVYIEMNFSAPFLRTKTAGTVELKEYWGTRETREIEFPPDQDAGKPENKVPQISYIFRIPAAASATPTADNKSMRVEFKTRDANSSCFLLTKPPHPYANDLRRGYFFIRMFRSISAKTISDYHYFMRTFADTSSKDFSFFNSPRANKRLISLISCKSMMFGEAFGEYYTYTTSHLMCIKRKASFDGIWYNKKGISIEIKKENGDRSFTPEEMKIINNIIASIRIIETP